MLHSKYHGDLVKGRMQYGRAWVAGERDDTPMLVEDGSPSPLDKLPRGTYIRLQFSAQTRPKSLSRLAAVPSIWESIIRTRTAAGQVLLGLKPIVDIDASLAVIDQQGIEHNYNFPPTFLYPHDVVRKPAFRFLDLGEYYEKYAEQAEPPAEKLRQDGLYLVWSTDKSRAELTSDQRDKFTDELSDYGPRLYAFIPYQGSVWGEMNQLLSGAKNRTYLYPGLMIAVNRQRLADIFEIEATRYETLRSEDLITSQKAVTL